MTVGPARFDRPASDGAVRARQTTGHRAAGLGAAGICRPNRPGSDRPSRAASSPGRPSCQVDLAGRSAALAHPPSAKNMRKEIGGQVRRTFGGGRSQRRPTSGTRSRTRSRLKSGSRRSASGAPSAGQPAGCGSRVPASAGSCLGRATQSREPSRTRSAPWTAFCPRPPAATRSGTASRGERHRGPRSRAEPHRRTPGRGAR